MDEKLTWHKMEVPGLLDFGSRPPHEVGWVRQNAK